MNWKHAWLVILIGFGFAANAQSDRAGLLQQACKQFDSALIKKDTAILRALLLDHFRMKHSNGLEETKEELQQHLSKGFLKYNEIVQEGEGTISLEEELGIVKRDLTVSGLLNGSPFNVKLKAFEIWTWNYADKRWQLRNRESTKAQ